MKNKFGLSRRTLMKGAAFTPLALGAGVSPLRAAADFKSFQSNGFFRFNVGDIEVTVLSDGTFLMPNAGLAANVDPAEVDAYLDALHPGATQQVRHMNCVLINTGDELILVDPGGGPDFAPEAGKLLENMEAAGYAVEDVDRVILTHAHPDHIWGLIDFFEEAPYFYNADYVMHEEEWNVWMAEDVLSNLPELLHSIALTAASQMSPIADMVTFFGKETEVGTGVSVVPLTGHTPGHSGVIVRSGGKELFLTVDALLHPQMSLEQPGWHPERDMMPEEAEATRRRLLDQLATDRMQVLAFHFPFPGLGRVAKRNGGYQWIPSDWEW